MTADFRERAVFRGKGHLYEDFEIGQKFVHHWGRTITEADTISFSTLLLHFNPIYFNRDYAKAHGHPDIVVNPHLLFNTVLGLSVQDCSELGGPFLGVYDLVYRPADWRGRPRYISNQLAYSGHSRFQRRRHVRHSLA